MEADIRETLFEIPACFWHLIGVDRETALLHALEYLPQIADTFRADVAELLSHVPTEIEELGREKGEEDHHEMQRVGYELAEAFAPFIFMLVDHATANKVDSSYLDTIFGQEIVSQVKNAQRLVRWACIATNPNVHESSDSILRGIAQIEDTLVVLCFLKGTCKEAESLTAALESALPELEALYDEFLDQELALSEEGIYQCILEHESCARAKLFELFEQNVPYIPKPPPSITLHRFRASA
ncbi:MAG: hypothetical protein KDB07_05810 [Planctomycetes bacterium]|nr:hypothetical protein [Planctomycetota bacterium]